MTPSKQIKEKIKKWEGLCLEAKKCPAGIPTIGYGHTGPDVAMGMKITQGKADRIFEEDIEMFADKVGKLTPSCLTQCQFDALVSFAFNCGLGNLSRSTLLKKVVANPTDPSIRSEFMRWVYAKVNGQNKVLPGLQTRRALEADHYFGKIS